jgi:hypothetical protein
MYLPGGSSVFGTMPCKGKNIYLFKFNGEMKEGGKGSKGIKDETQGGEG